MVIIHGILRKEHNDAGFSLEEEDIVWLKCGLNILACWPTRRANIEEILYEADQHLNWQRSGITFEKEGN